MRNLTGTSEAHRDYGEAYATHYVTRDLPLALRLYRQIMTAHPGTQEAEYARMQIHNLITSVVPKQELLDAQVQLVLAHFEQAGSSDASV